MGGPRRSRPGVVAAVAAAVVVLFLCGLGASKLLSGGSGGGSNAVTTGTLPSAGGGQRADVADNNTQDRARAQAQALQALLDRSRNDRRTLLDAIDAVSNCQNLAASISNLQQVAADRSAELSGAQQLQVDSLPDGNDLKSTLTGALNYSAQADESFVQWALGVQSGDCSSASQQSAALDDANNASGQATTAKRAFISVWTPVAQQYNLPVPTETDI
jgi:hypothetical protein